jgi:excisionase family DNA binding protein
MDQKKYLTVEEVATRFGLNTTTVYRLAGQGKLTCFKVGNQWRFNTEQLKKWESQQANLKSLQDENRGPE